MFRPTILGMLFQALLAITALQAGGSDVHAPFDALLQKYVRDTRFDYAALHQNTTDLQHLSAYVDELERLDPYALPRNEALTYWINLYNAATLELVMQHYPLKSIKDIGGFMRSPWKRTVVTIAAKELTLDNIEHDIIRPTYKDARIHFAVNCASLGCPPLSNRAYSADNLDEQLDAACRAAVNNERWVKIGKDKLELSKIFDWFEDDFTASFGSVRDFLARYIAAEQRSAVLDQQRKFEISDYDWRLNQAL